MLTGDSQSGADAVAAATGIDEVHAKLLPEGKLNELGKIRNKYGAVMFVGDGINDAPVLAGADVGMPPWEPVQMLPLKRLMSYL